MTRRIALMVCVVFCLILAVPAWAQTSPICETKILPDQGNDPNNANTIFSIPPSVVSGQLTNVTTLINYTPPSQPTGLEFWMHNFNPATPNNTIALAIYLVSATGRSQRMALFLNNTAEEHGGFHNFALSTFLHVGEILRVVAVNFNNTAQTVNLAVTMRECH